jgi:DNA replication protein DnaC
MRVYQDYVERVLQTANVLVLVDDDLSYAKFQQQKRDGYVQIITEIHSHSIEIEGF